MKKLFVVLTLSFLVVAFQACKKEPKAPDNGGNGKSAKVVFTATAENLETDSDAEYFWMSGEQIMIVLDDGNTVNATLVDGAGTSTGSFVSTIPSGKTALFAVHPTSALESAEGNTANISIPDSQAGNSAMGTISVGKVESGNKIAFKNMNAVLGFQLKGGTEVSKIEVISVDGTSLAGVMAVDCSGAEPVAGTFKTPTSSVSTTTFGAGTYYLTVASGNHAQGLKIKTYSGSESYTEAGEYDWDIDTLSANKVYVYEIKEVIESKMYYVTVEGAGTKDGKSLENAMSAAQMWSFLKLEDGKTLADLNGSVFNIGAGTYDWGAESTLTFDEGARFSFVGIKGETIFSGNSEHRILKVDGEVDVEIEGISFVNGQVSVAAEGGEDGGALYITSGTWVLKDCSFSDNKATNGGAIEITGGTVTITDCTFNNNEALNDDPERKDGTGFGGAVDFDSESGTITISGCAFTGNLAWRGGAVDIYKTGSNEATIIGSTFTDNGNDKARDGGALYIAASTSMKNCTLTGNTAKYGGAMKLINHHISIEGGSFVNNTASGNAGAISVGEKGRLEIGNEEAVTFQGNSAELYGGALEVESFRESLGNNIHNAVFRENHAQWGGAVAVYGKSGKTTGMYFKDCTVEGNYATKDGGAFYVEDESLIDLTRTIITANHADNMGGAVCVHGWKRVQAFQSSFVGNYAATGGAVFGEKSGDQYPDIFIDECSFDGNYITKNYGCVFNFNHINSFCMNNSSVRDSYITPSKTGEKGCWIDFDNVQGVTSISNCSIIGTAASSSLVWSCGGSWTDYLTNNIIVQANNSEKSIHSDGNTLNVSYTVYSASSSIATSDNNTSGKSSGSIDDLAWSIDNSTSYYWKWNGQIGGSAPSLISKAAFVERLTGICPEFVEWCGDDINMDQRNVARGDSWWPGAYQN